MTTMEITVNETVCNATDFDASDLISLAREALTRPAESGWNDQELWETHTLMFATPAWHLTDDYVVGEANYRAVLRDFTEKYPDDVSDASFGHWTYSTYNCIKVRVIDENGCVTQAFAELAEIAKNIAEQYPLYDEEMHSTVESEKFDSHLEWLIGEVKNDIDSFRDEIVSLPDGFDETWEQQFRTFIYDSEDVTECECDVPDDVVKQAVAFADSGWTIEQYRKMSDLCKRYMEAFKFTDYKRYPTDSTMMPGWVEGWIGGKTDTIYVGVSPEGDSHS